MTPSAYIIDDAWAIIKQYVVDYSYTHKTKMIHVMGELRDYWASAGRKYFLGTDGSLLCIRYERFTIVNSEGRDHFTFPYFN